MQGFPRASWNFPGPWEIQVHQDFPGCPGISQDPGKSQFPGNSKGALGIPSFFLAWVTKVADTFE